MLGKLFALEAHGTSIRIEVLAGFTTFLTMIYIVVVNPLIMGDAGLPVGAVAIGTCLAAGAGCLLMGLLSNTPLAMAPGMGLNAYFTYTVVKGMGVPWPTALGCVFISGAAFFVLTAIGARQLIVNAIPRSLFSAVAGGIGLFIAFIGLKDAGVIVANPATTVGLGDLTSPGVLVAMAGLLVIGVLMARKVRAAMLIGILVASLGGWFAGLTHAPGPGLGLGEISATAFKLDIPAALGLRGNLALTVVEIIFVFLFVDLFDNVGTLVAVTKRAGLVDAGGTIPRLNRILYADSLAAMLGALVGVSTVTSYIESASGVAAGGRTGLTSVVVGLLFLATIFVAPLVALIPSAATAPALILVGSLMVGSLSEIDWVDPVVAIPAFLTLIAIPLTYSIANGLAFGIVSYALLTFFTGRARREDWLVFVLAALFVVRFVYIAKGWTMRSLIAALVLLLAVPAVAGAKPIEIRVVIVTTWEVELNGKDAFGELHAWRAKWPLATELPFPLGVHPLLYDPKRHLLAVVTGVATARAAASITALGADPRFDLTHAYWILAGTAGVDPKVASAGSAAWARWVIDGDLAQELDPRDAPSDWPTGIVPYGRTTPYQTPAPPGQSSDANVAYPLNPALVDWAYQQTRTVKLADDALLTKLRAPYAGLGATPPFVLEGESLASARNWYGAQLNDWARRWTSYWTADKGVFAMSDEEDSGVMQALTFLAHAGRARLDRVLILRAGSDYTVGPPDLTAAQFLAKEARAGFPATPEALDALYRVASPVAAYLADDWTQTREVTPGSLAGR